MSQNMSYRRSLSIAVFGKPTKVRVVSLAKTIAVFVDNTHTHTHTHNHTRVCVCVCVCVCIYYMYVILVIGVDVQVPVDGLGAQNSIPFCEIKMQGSFTLRYRLII